MTRDYHVEELLKYKLSNHPRYLAKEKASYCNYQKAKTMVDYQEEPFTKKSVSKRK